MKIENLPIITDKELPNYSPLGTATGISLDHCAFLGSQHCPNFLERVAGYRIERDDKISEAVNDVMRKENNGWPTHLTISFYEKKG
jgi:hypothetical protein